MLRIHFFYRVLAFFIDITLLWLLMTGIKELLSLLMPGINMAAPALLLAQLAILTFYLLGEALTGFTPGKLILGIRAGTVEGKEGSIGFYALRLLVKNVYLWVSVVYGWINLMLYYHGKVQIDGHSSMPLVMICLFVAFLASCVFALNSPKQALHDRLLGSAVFYNRDLEKRLR